MKLSLLYETPLNHYEIMGIAGEDEADPDTGFGKSRVALRRPRTKDILVKKLSRTKYPINIIIDESNIDPWDIAEIDTYDMSNEVDFNHIKIDDNEENNDEISDEISEEDITVNWQLSDIKSSY